MRVRRLMVAFGAVGAVVLFNVAALSPSTLAQGAVSEGETCAVKGGTAMSTTTGRALVCTDVLDNGGGIDVLRWRVQTANNTAGGATTTTVVTPTTTPATTVPAVTQPTTATAANAAAPMPTTGVDAGRWAGEAASLTGLGAVLLIAGRRRRRGFASSR